MLKKNKKTKVVIYISNEIDQHDAYFNLVTSKILSPCILKCSQHIDK